MASKRIVFSFKPLAFEQLEKAMNDGKYASYADTVRAALSLLRSVQVQRKVGFEELIVSNGRRSKVIMLP